MSEYIVDTEFKDNDFSISPLAKGDYENCTFINCNFDHVNLSERSFCECHFIRCHFNATAMYKTSWREVNFTESKLTGLQFDECNNPIVDFSIHGSTLECISFCDQKLLRFIATDSKIAEVDFTNAHMGKASLTNCNFDKTIFHNTHLEEANFIRSYNYFIDPDQNYIKKARFSIHAIEGLLYKYDILIDR